MCLVTVDAVLRLGHRAMCGYAARMAVVVRLSGAFRVLVDDVAGTERVVGSPKARRLLALLAARRGAVVSPEQLVDALWGAHPPEQPERNVATLISRLRAQLGPDVIVGDRRGYRLGAAQVDIDEAARLVAESGRRLDTGAPALAAAAAARALELLGSGSALLGEPDVDWVDALRAEVRGLVGSARHRGAEAALRIGRGRAAVDLCVAAVADDRFDETAHRLLMRAYRAVGEPARALETFRELAVALRDELGVEPAAQTRRVHLAILRGERDGAAVAAHVSPSGAPGIVGRDAELSLLGAAWEAACRRQPAVLLLVGDAGFGKTRLADEAVGLAEATGGRAVISRCYAAERSLFLQPFVEALTQALAGLSAEAIRGLSGARGPEVAELLPEFADALGGPEPGRSSPEAERRRAFEAVTLMLTRLATDRPLLLVLDDLHNTGRASVELLHYLARRAGTARLLVVGTVRAEEGAELLDALAGVTRRCEVGPLPPAAVAQLAAAAGRAELAEAILARTRGHALFVVETLRGLAAGDPGMPDTLQAAVLSRLARAGPEVEELLRAGAVLGSAVDPDVLAGMLGLALSEAARRCERAAATRLLLPVGRTYEFSNDLVQEVLYATTPAPTRAVHHRRAADLLTATPEAVAAHAAASEDWQRAARAWLLAGERARRRSAADAVALLDQALDAAQRGDDPGLVGRVFVARGRAREALGRCTDALDDHRAALAAARAGGDRRLEMTALRELGGDAVVGAGLAAAECVPPLRDSLRIAATLGDRAAEADAHARLAVLATHRLAFAEAYEHGRRSAAAGRAAGDEQALLVGLDGLKTAYAYLGELAELRTVIEELEPLARRTGDLLRLHWVLFEGALPAIAAANWKGAQDRIAAALEANRRSGYVAHEVWMLAHLGWVARLQGLHEEAVDLGRRAMTLGDRDGHRWWRPAARALLAGTLLERGDVTEAVDLLAEVVDQARQNGAEIHLLRCLAPLAEATGDVAILAEADALLRGIDVPAGAAWLTGMDAYAAVARAWTARDEPGRARQVLAPLLAAATRTSWLPALAIGTLEDGRAAVRLGAVDEARTALGRARRLAESHGMRHVAQEAAKALAPLC
jgi:DNA-binding SARP family transcriptional activator/tetratricopeptide (TPR) repeat protein